MRKKPFRPTNDISQQFNSGVVKIYSVADTAPSGFRPVEGLSLKGTLRYEELRLGIYRHFEGKQNQVEIARVIRVPFRDEVSTQDVAITEDGKQFRVDLVQLAVDVFPRSMDLSLARIEQDYEVPA